MKVGMSIAHNTRSLGACFHDFCEHKESDIWTGLLIRELTILNVKTYLSESENLSIERRNQSGGSKVYDINKAQCDIALEIHFNACGGCPTNGCETLYYPGSTKGRLIANAVQKRLCLELGNNDRGVKEGWYKMDRPGVIDFYGDKEGDEMPNYFLQHTNCPAIIIEPEFIHNIETIMNSRLSGVMAIAEAIKSLENEL